MKLLNSRTLEMKTFISEDKVPAYAILSHTWAADPDDEVSFQDWKTTPSDEVKDKSGFLKIRYTCEQAAEDGIEWVWVDTCCIDKTSSAELSEAINSMFRWYQNALVCYAHLSDVSWNTNNSFVLSGLRQSRWFKRGWTLQELIAPSHVSFFTHNWHYIGSKLTLSDIITSITGIDEIYLHGEDLEKASLSKKMSWAANRETSRIEDIAYCLFGIFDVNMSLIYGEGFKAFRRLQHEIMHQNPYDHTLFAWGEVVKLEHLSYLAQHEDIYGNTSPIWNRDAAEPPLLGLLADSPREFRDSGSFSIHPYAKTCYDMSEAKSIVPTQFHKGIRIDLPIREVNRPGEAELVFLHNYVFHWNQPRITQLRPLQFAMLLCSSSTENFMLAVPLRGWGDMSWGRSRELVVVNTLSTVTIRELKRSYFVEPQRLDVPSHGSVIFRRISNNSSYRWCKTNSGMFSLFKTGSRILHMSSELSGTVSLWFMATKGTKSTGTRNALFRGFELQFSRPKRNGKFLGQITLMLSPLVFNNHGEDLYMDGIIWYEADPKVYRSMGPPLYSIALGVPADTWTLETAFFPRIQISIERMELDEQGVFVDVVDLVVGQD